MVYVWSTVFSCLKRKWYNLLLCAFLYHAGSEICEFDTKRNTRKVFITLIFLSFFFLVSQINNVCVDESSDILEVFTRQDQHLWHCNMVVFHSKYIFKLRSSSLIEVDYSTSQLYLSPERLLEGAIFHGVPKIILFLQC